MSAVHFLHIADGVPQRLHYILQGIKRSEAEKGMEKRRQATRDSEEDQSSMGDPTNPARLGDAVGSLLPGLLRLPEIRRDDGPQ